jgi:hypothetical protein
MQTFSKKQIILAVVVFLVLGISVVTFVLLPKEQPAELIPVVEQEHVGPQQKIIGTSVQERNIESYTYGNSLPGQEQTHLVFVGGVHGGYEWNSVLLAYTFIDYFTERPESIPENITVTIIPSANPDGVYKILGKEGVFSVEDVPEKVSTVPGRFNARNVDLNRNFDCKWKAESTWRGDIVSAGTEPFSEPEAKAIRDFVQTNKPNAVIFWHSQANTVYASECETGILAETLDIMNAYAAAAEYQAVELFDTYEITGDAEGWLASIGIPAITVELETHQDIDWERNLAGVQALLDYYESQR